MSSIHRIAAAAALSVAVFTTGAQADQFLGSYTARISAKDHYASDGYPLSSAAQMVRQDRANWHRFGRGDAEDEDDPFFTSQSKRARLEQLLKKSGAISSSVRNAIVNGEPVVKVEVYANSVKVRLLGY